MTKSKFDPYREFILDCRQAGKPIQKIKQELKAQGCPASRSGLTKWLRKLEDSEDIELPPLKRGRPARSKVVGIHFLPRRGSSRHGKSLPMFMVALQEMPDGVRRNLRDQALEDIGLPQALNLSGDVDRFNRLSDLELCLLALLRSDLPSPPLASGPNALTDWFAKLVPHACQLRVEIRAVSDQKRASSSER